MTNKHDKLKESINAPVAWKDAAAIDKIVQAHTLALAVRKVDEYTQLIDETQLAHCISALESRLEPCGRFDGFECAKVLFGAYKKTDVEDKEQYTLHCSSVLGEVPKDLARKTVDILTRECQWLPNRADIVKVSKELVRKRRVLLHNAHMMRAEWKRRKDAAIEEQKLAEDREAFKAKHGGKTMMEVLREQGFGAQSPDDAEADA